MTTSCDVVVHQLTPRRRSLAIIIALLVTCKDKHTASYTFTSSINGSGWGSEGLVFLLGLLSVQVRPAPPCVALRQPLILLHDNSGL